MPERTDPISAWFEAAESLDEFIGIRFGQLRPGKAEPEWTFLRHAEFDGIGGLADILRKRGIELPRLPQIKHPAEPSLTTMLRTWISYAAPRRALKLRAIEGEARDSTGGQPPTAVAWYAFDKASTTEIRRVCRRSSVTVNSFLLKHLTKAIRPYLLDESSVVPWLLPVNMRGKVKVRQTDTGNYSSYVGVRVSSYETAGDIHRNVYAALKRGEHWANWYAYQSGHFLTHGMMRYLIRAEKCTSQWSLGAFSNLGDWDAEAEIQQPDCQGPWFFCPPVLRMQKIGAGCITFQNRLSLTLQAHQSLTMSPKTLRVWMANWVKEIEMDIASILADSATTFLSRHAGAGLPGRINMPVG